MKDRKIVARLVFLLYLAVVILLCFGHFSDMSGVPRRIWNFDTDKIVHLLMFLPFPVLFYIAFRWRTYKPWQSLVLALAILAIGCVIAVGTEYIQGFLPYRSEDPADFRADFLALCFSSIIVLLTDLNKPTRHA